MSLDWIKSIQEAKCLFNHQLPNVKCPILWHIYCINYYISIYSLALAINEFLKKINKSKLGTNWNTNATTQLHSYFLIYNNLSWGKWKERKNPQFNFFSQNLSLERNFFKWDGKVTKIKHLLFHRMWKNIITWNEKKSRYVKFGIQKNAKFLGILNINFLFMKNDIHFQKG